MYYIVLENGAVISILNYEPNVPIGAEVITITDNDYQNLMNDTHFFDIPSKTVKAHATDYIQQQQNKVTQDRINAENREFLNSTDWKVLRHLRQKALGVATSLSDAEYLALEQQRTEAASRIINN